MPGPCRRVVGLQWKANDLQEVASKKIVGPKKEATICLYMHTYLYTPFHVEAATHFH